jgi:peptidoglycan glycosyltransferase
VSARLAHDIKRLAGLTMAGYLLTTAATFYWGFLRSDALAARADNPRRPVEDRRIQRGRILDRSGRVLAFSQPSADGGVASRSYPYPAAAPVVGFQTWRYGAGLDPGVSYGAGGAEAAYDAALRGDVGQPLTQQVATLLLQRPQVGRDVVLTLDAELQNYAAEQLGDREGAVVVLDTQSGAVRALVSQPTFDPRALDEAAAGSAPVPAMLNRATQALYPPGSTWKIVTLAAALNDGLVSLDDVVTDGDRIGYFDGFPVRCDNNPEGVTSFDIAHAFAYSCNVTFAQLGVDLGARRFREYAAAFGLTEAPPFPLPTVAGGMAGDDMSQAELASSAFGQGQLVITPMGMALVVAAIARDGTLPVPTLLADVPGVRWGSIADERGTWRRAVPARTARLVRQAMIVSAEDGWARAARNAAGLALGAKTGTAETGTGQPHAWTVAFAPADDPTLAVAVLVAHGGSGAAAAAPIAGRVLARGLALDAAARSGGG